MAAQFPNYSAQDFVKDLRHDTYPFVDPKKLNLSGKYVFITGASKGIGRALAIAYAQAGAAGIAIGARSDLTSLEKEVDQAASATGRQAPKVIKMSLDVTDLASAEAAAKATESAFGKLDVLVNNAGYLATWAKTAEGDPSEWWRTWEVNIKGRVSPSSILDQSANVATGVYYLKKAFIPLLLKGGDKTIINLSSVGAHFVRPGASAYQPSKLVVCRLAEFASQEYAEEGLLAYSVHPGGSKSTIRCSEGLD